jgi:hypothetical protein
MDLKHSSDSGMPDSSLTIAIIMAAVGSSTSLNFKFPDEKSSSTIDAGCSVGTGSIIGAGIGFAIFLFEIAPSAKENSLIIKHKARRTKKHS